MKVLLERGGVNSSTPGIAEPLLRAGQHGHEGVVKILLEQDDVDPDRPSQYGQTPLLCAGRNGHEGVSFAVSLLRSFTFSPFRLFTYSLFRRSLIVITPISITSQ